MASTMEVHLQNVRVAGLHGLHEGEEVIGGEFEVNLITTFIPYTLPVSTIDQTVDYTALLSLVKERMKKPAFLLETLATEIASEIFAKFPVVTELAISISKLHPPIVNFEGSVGVTFKTTRD